MITYEIEYSKCRKTIGIIVERNKHIVVRAPEGYSPSKIAEIVASKKTGLNQSSKMNENILISRSVRNLYREKV